MRHCFAGLLPKVNGALRINKLAQKDIATWVLHFVNDQNYMQPAKDEIECFAALVFNRDCMALLSTMLMGLTYYHL